MTLVRNPPDAKEGSRTTEQDAILSDATLAKAQPVTTSWHDHAPTPLVALPSPEQKAGCATLHLKDEGPRLGIGSLRALGWAHAASDTSGRVVAAEAAHAEGSHMVSDTSWGGCMDMSCHVMQGYEIMAMEAFDALPEAPGHIFLQTGVGGMAAPATEVAVETLQAWPVACPAAGAAIGLTPTSRAPDFSTEGNIEPERYRGIVGLAASPRSMP